MEDKFSEVDKTSILKLGEEYKTLVVKKEVKNSEKIFERYL